MESSISCIDKNQALSLKIIAIFSILVTSVIGVTLPLLTRSIPAFSPERNLFVIVKAFAAGIILATGFMHVLPDSFDMLSSSCLAENPWHNFPFTGLVAMLSAVVTLMIDSMATSFYSAKSSADTKPEDQFASREMGTTAGHFHGHHHENSQLIRYRVIAMVSLLQYLSKLMLFVLR